MASRSMALDFGLDKCPGRRMKFRWLLTIEDVCGTTSKGVSTLPPIKSARPSYSFREAEARHLVETIYYPTKIDTKPLQVTLYDTSNGKHPIMEWLKKLYDPKEATWKFPAVESYCKTASLILLDGCGKTIETWTYEDVWPLSADFTDLDMGSSEVVTCDLTLRYSRAYLVESGS